MQIPTAATYLLQRLNDAGFEAFLVGGCVRDWLRGEDPQDWDIATAATPQQVHEALGDLTIIDTGIKHGTVTVVMEVGSDDSASNNSNGNSTVDPASNSAGNPRVSFEVTSFRSEGPYLDGRRPSSVSYVQSIEEDLARRDFTINALAYHPQKGLVDPFGGEQDLKQAVLRAVGDPIERLNEDALRIMRALRFAANLGLDIEPGLSKALHELAPNLRRIAAERIRDELMKLLPGSHILAVLMAYPDVLAVPIPEIEACVGFDQRSIYHCYDVWEHTARAIALSKPDALVRLTLLFHDFAKPACFVLDEEGRGHFYNHDLKGAEIATARLRTLRFDSKTVTLVSKLIRWHSAFLRPRNLKRWLSRMGPEGLATLIEVRRGDILSHSEVNLQMRKEQLEETERMLAELLESNPCFTRIDLAIDGNDIKGLGVAPGPRIGEILDLLFDAVLDDKLENDHDTLYAAAQKLVEQNPQ